MSFYSLVTEIVSTNMIRLYVTPTHPYFIFTEMVIITDLPSKITPSAYFDHTEIYINNEPFCILDI